MEEKARLSEVGIAKLLVRMIKFPANVGNKADWIKSACGCLSVSPRHCIAFLGSTNTLVLVENQSYRVALIDEVEAGPVRKVRSQTVFRES